MSNERPDAAAQRWVVDHPEQFLAPLAPDGFSLRPRGRQEPIEVVAAPGGWRVDGPGGIDGWLLRREGSGSGGFVLQTPDAETEAGWTLSHSRIGGEASLSYLILDDGRLFRIALRGPRRPRFELLDREMPGAYLIASPETQGWTIRPTPACGGLKDIRSISILFAAEILAAEGALPGGEESD
jgi:hypothetical protein